MYLSQVKNQFGIMLNYVVYGLKEDLNTFWDKFISSDLCKRLEKGDITVISGKSGIEITYEILGFKQKKITYLGAVGYKSEEYWAGWAISYYQWSRNISFKKIDTFI